MYFDAQTVKYLLEEYLVNFWQINMTHWEWSAVVGKTVETVTFTHDESGAQIICQDIVIDPKWQRIISATIKLAR